MVNGSAVVLLGAGASVEAGLPTSTQLTQRIVEDISRGPSGAFRGLSQAINFAVGALIAHDTARGADAFSGIDVERLFAAVRMLSDRDNLEIAPFVSSWSDGLRFMHRQGSFPAFFDKEFANAIQRGGRSLERLFVNAIKSVTNESAPDEIFKDLGTDMISSLRACLDLDGTTVDYLAPLLSKSANISAIATLNYDRSIELLAGRAGLDITTGIDLWSGGYDWDWEAGKDARLLKLHGSLDWVLEKAPTASGLSRETVRRHTHSNGEPRSWGRYNLGVIFGQREKLRADGPFLAMLREFGELLKPCNHLVVAGYSFRDDHINAAIRRWFTDAPDSSVTIIDPIFSGDRPAWSKAGGFLREFVAAMTDRDSRELGQDHALLGVGAGEGLKQVFGEGPSLQSIDSLHQTLSTSPLEH